jgi:hypothetical protein
MTRSSLESFSSLWRAYGGRLDESLDLVDPDCQVTLLDGAARLRGHARVRDALAAAPPPGRG